MTRERVQLGMVDRCDTVSERLSLGSAEGTFPNPRDSVNGHLVIKCEVLIPEPFPCEQSKIGGVIGVYADSDYTRPVDSLHSTILSWDDKVIGFRLEFRSFAPVLYVRVSFQLKIAQKMFGEWENDSPLWAQIVVVILHRTVSRDNSVDSTKELCRLEEFTKDYERIR
jgi:hypothetical protein